MRTQWNLNKYIKITKYINRFACPMEFGKIRNSIIPTKANRISKHKHILLLVLFFCCCCDSFTIAVDQLAAFPTK